MLPAVQRAAWLVRRQAGDDAEIDVGVVAQDVGVGVVEDACFQCQK